MDRKALAQLTHKASNFLTLDNNIYKQWVFRYTFLELEKDLGANGDITTNSIFEDPRVVTAKIFARESGVLAGMDEVKYFLVDANENFRPRVNGKFSIDFKKRDGELINKGDVLMEISAELHDLLAVERVVLNLLMRMSGVASKTQRIVHKVAEYRSLIVSTRKTLWGLLDKKAVFVGGGGTHRLNLSDAVLIKDTHLDLMGRDFYKVLKTLCESKPYCRFIEVETEGLDEAMDAAKFLSTNLSAYNINTMGVIMFDNIEPDKIKEALDGLKKENLYENLLFEASGGVNEANVLEYAKTGVDIISMGELTNGVKSLDMSMKIAFS
ncbi:MAG: carboxylating nicotinate-nucleotide diphosphorylase [Candidatus Gracilibacteria bacterium]|nr:carboxylating nicotinate-nucleotide diphosphorylase [Candidatus Gracilibacteria bacterium]